MAHRLDYSDRYRFVACPICDREETTYAFSVSGMRLDRCAWCGLLFANPQPDSAELSRIYGADYLLGAEDGSDETLSMLKRGSARILIDTALGHAHKNLPQRLKLLDVGCGAGYLLAEATSLGFEATGVDISDDLLQKAAIIAPEAELLAGDVESLDIPPGSFDICILSDVLEHVRNPLAVLKTLWGVLSPQGILLVATPSLSSLTSRSMKKKWLEYKREHLYYFSPSTLQTALYKSGFSHIRMHPLTKILNVQYIEHHFERYPSDSVLGRTFRTAARLLPRSLKQRPVRLAGSGMIAVARRAQERPIRLNTLSVIVPVYNEKATFPVIAGQLREKRLPGLRIEVIIVESNSTDGTREEVMRLKGSDRFKIVLQDAPLGKGLAVREGLRHATGDIVLIQDADLEYDMQDYEALLRPILQLRSSFVLGSRHTKGAMKMRKFTKKPAISLLFNLAHAFLTTLFNWLHGQRLRDPFTMYKVFLTDAVDGIEFRRNGFDFDPELVFKLIRKGFRPIEVPVNYSSRDFAEGKKVSWFDFFLVLRTILVSRLDSGMR